jgi:hypothetical protein
MKKFVPVLNEKGRRVAAFFVFGWTAGAGHLTKHTPKKRQEKRCALTIASQSIKYLYYHKHTHI